MKSSLKKTVSFIAAFAILFNSLVAPLSVLAQEVTPTPTPEATVEPSVTPEATPIDATTPTPEATPDATPTATPTVAPEPTPSPSPWTFEKVELNKEYQNGGVTLTFTKLPSPAGNIKIEEITLTPEQIQQTGSLSDKAYDITSNMTDGSFSYNLSLPIPDSSKGKSVEVKFAEELSNIETAKKVENTLTKTDTSVSVTSLNHFTIFVVAGAVPTTTVVSVTNLLPSWTGDGGGGVFSAYVGPAYDYVSPGSTTLYDGREAGKIEAGLNAKPDGHYDDEGLFGFTPNVTINTFAAGTLTYDVENQYGENPVWMTIEIDTGVAGVRSDNTTYQYVPTAYSAGWHTIDAAAGQWQKWNNGDGDVTGNPFMSLSAIAAAHPGLNVVRAYLRLGMGDSYHGTAGHGTVAWVDKVTISGTTYDFVTTGETPTSCTGVSVTLPSGTTACYTTIQAAIAGANSGDTINVAAGTYTEVGQIVINKNLTIVGADRATTIIKPDTDYADGWFLVNTGINFNLSKVTLDGTGKKINKAIIHRGSGVIDDNNFTEIKNSSMNEGLDRLYAGTAIAIDSTENVDITNNEFTQIGRNGILADGNTGTVSGNTYTGKGAGDWMDYFILSEYGDNVTISNNVISNNLGVALTDGSDSSAIAVWDDSGTQATITGNTMTNNTTGVAVAALSGGTNPKVVIGAGNLFDGGKYGVALQNYVSSYSPDVTFVGASTFKGQSEQAIYIYDGVSVGQTIDISSVIFKTAGGTVITDSSVIEGLVYHLNDASNRGLLKWDYTAPTATVAYNIATPTNGSVVATITPSETVTGALTHTFTDNGSFTFDFTDLAGNPGSAVATVSNIDTVAPVIAAHSMVTAEATSPSGATVNYTAPNATDNIDATAPATCSQASGTIFPIADTTVTCNKTDTAGNAAIPTTFIVRVQDTTKPTNVTASDSGAFTNDPHLTFTWPTSIDGGSGINYYNFYLNTASSHSIPVPFFNELNIGNVTTYTLTDTQAALLSSGTNYYAKVRAVDNVGLSQSSGGNWSDGITLDTTAPIISFDSITAPNENGWINSDVTVNWNCSDSGSGAVSSAVSQTLTGEGTNQSATGTCTDNVGNTSSNTQTGINIDKTPPSISFDAPASGSLLRSTVLLQATGSDEGGSGLNPLKFSYRKSADSEFTDIGIDSAAPYEMPWDTTSVTDGDYVLRVAASDGAGSISWSDVNVTIDNTAPTTPTASPIAGNYMTDQSVTLASSDSGSGFKNIYYTLDGSTPDNSKTLYVGAITVNHDMTIKAIAYDNAGNASGVLEAVYGIAPVISGETSSSVSETTVTINWTTDDLSTSRVVYDTVSHALGSAPNYGYAASTVEDSTEVTSHSVGLTGLTAGTTYYYRTVSHGSPEAVSDEQTFTTSDHDVCKNIDGIQTGVPDGMHLDASGLNCVNFSQSGPAPRSDEGNSNGQVLGISTPTLFKTWPKLAYAGNASIEENVLGTETEATIPSATTTPEASLTPTPQPEKVGAIKWILTHKKISGGISLILLLIAYGFYRASRKNK